VIWPASRINTDWRGTPVLAKMLLDTELQGIERLGHARFLDGLHVEPIADGHGTADVRDQQARELDLAVVGLVRAPRHPLSSRQSPLKGALGGTIPIIATPAAAAQQGRGCRTMVQLPRKKGRHDAGGGAPQRRDFATVQGTR
jgi:hypothetical protein